MNINGYDKKELSRLVNEVTLLKTLKNKHLIRFYGIWDVPDKQKLVFITEFMESGTIKQYVQYLCSASHPTLYTHSLLRFRQKYPVSRGKIREWCRGILECLAYLHSEVPASEGVEHRAPIIHRDLKCDNIFVSSASKSVKVGDLGLATTDGRSAMGTPEFMAPDVFDGKYTTSVDIHSFGMCVLEMVTGASPYGECDSFAQVSNRVLAGQMPDSLKALKVAWPQAHRFVCLCLKGVEDDGASEAPDSGPSGPLSRPSAAELLKHPLLAESATDNSVDTEEMLEMVHAAGIQIPVSGGGFLQLKVGTPVPSTVGKGPLAEATEQDPSAQASVASAPAGTVAERTTLAGDSQVPATDGAAVPSSHSTKPAKTAVDLQRSSSAASSASDGSSMGLGRQLSVEGTPGPLVAAFAREPSKSTPADLGAGTGTGTGSETGPAGGTTGAAVATSTDAQQGVPNTIAEEEHDSDGDEGPVGLHEDVDDQSSTAEGSAVGVVGGDAHSTTSAPAAAKSVPSSQGAQGSRSADAERVSPASAPATPAAPKRELQEHAPVTLHAGHSTPVAREFRSVPNSGAVTPGVASVSRSTPAARPSTPPVHPADTGGTGDAPAAGAYKQSSSSPPSSAKTPLSPGAGASSSARVNSVPRAASRTTVEFHHDSEVPPLGSPPVASAGSAGAVLSATPSSPGKGSFAPSSSAAGAAPGAASGGGFPQGAGGTGMTAVHATGSAAANAGSGATSAHVDPAGMKSSRAMARDLASGGAPLVQGGSSLRRFSAQPQKGNHATAALHRLQADVVDLRRDMDSVLDSVTELNSMMRFLVNNQLNGREALAAMDDAKQQRLQNRAAAQRMSSAAAATHPSVRQPVAAPLQGIPTTDGAAGDASGRRVRASSIGSTSSNLSLPSAHAMGDVGSARAPTVAAAPARSSMTISAREPATAGSSASRSLAGSTTPSPPPERVLNLQDDGPVGASKFVARSIHQISAQLTKDERSAGSILAARFSMQPDQLLVDTPSATADGAQNFVEKRSMLLDRFERDVAEEFGKVRKKLESLDNTLTDNLQQTQLDIETENNKHRKEAQRMRESRQNLNAESAEQELSAGDAALEGEAKKSSVRAQNTRRANMDRKQKLQTEREEREQQRHSERLDQLEGERSRRQRVAVDKRRVLVDGRTLQVSHLAETLRLHVQGLVRETTGMMDPAEQAEAMARAAAARPSSQSAPGTAQPISASPIALSGARQGVASVPGGAFGVPSQVAEGPMRPPLRRENSAGSMDTAAFTVRSLPAGTPSESAMPSAPRQGIARAGPRPGAGGSSGFSTVAKGTGGLRHPSTLPGEKPSGMSGHSSAGL